MSARPGLCGGRSAMVVPTAISTIPQLDTSLCPIPGVLASPVRKVEFKLLHIIPRSHSRSDILVTVGIE